MENTIELNQKKKNKKITYLIFIQSNKNNLIFNKTNIFYVYFHYYQSLL